MTFAIPEQDLETFSTRKLNAWYFDKKPKGSIDILSETMKVPPAIAIPHS